MKLEKHLKLIAGIVLIGGLLGGIGNYVVLDSNVPNNSLVRSLVLGVIAAAVLPLFLKLISSNLLDLHEDSIPYKNYLSLVGFCLLASLFADVFLNGIYSKVFSQVSDRIEKVEVQTTKNNIKTNLLVNGIRNERITLDKSEQEIKNTIAKYKLSPDETKLYRDINDSIFITNDYIGSKNLMNSQEKVFKQLQAKGLIQKLSINDQDIYVGKNYIKQPASN